eukprot:m.209918 g.209918  ORF g.209918 m.209918 type:complete len:164 (-) comp33057_c0_seq1:215-706(-)
MERTPAVDNTESYFVVGVGIDFVHDLPFHSYYFESHFDFGFDWRSGLDFGEYSNWVELMFENFEVGIEHAGDDVAVVFDDDVQRLPLGQHSEKVAFYWFVFSFSLYFLRGFVLFWGFVLSFFWGGFFWGEGLSFNHNEGSQANSSSQFRQGGSNLKRKTKKKG